MKKWIISAKTSRTVGKVCSYILLIFFACIFFMPFLWMLSTAVKLYEPDISESAQVDSGPH